MSPILSGPCYWLLFLWRAQVPKRSRRTKWDEYTNLGLNYLYQQILLRMNGSDLSKSCKGCGADTQLGQLGTLNMTSPRTKHHGLTHVIFLGCVAGV